MIGIDLVKINRIAKLIDRRGLLFVQEMLNTREKNIDTLAGIFAAKEALGKYIGKGISIDLLKNSKIVKDDYGKPSIFYNNKVYSLSISHDGEYACSIVGGIESIMIDEKIKELLIKRPSGANKSTFGRVGIVSGGDNMIGCSRLSSMAAMRSGAGYVYVFASDFEAKILKQTLIEPIIMNRDDIFYFCNLDSIAIGPGIGFSEINYIEKLFQNIIDKDIKTVIDADGFYYLKKLGNPGIKRLVLTPHPLEAARLIDVDIKEVLNNREKVAKEIAKKYDADVIIKGENTLICSIDGDIFINKTGNNGLATAGSGDVLTGIIAAFMASGNTTLEAARLGVYFHGLSADYLSEKISKRAMIASDIIEGLKFVFKEEDNVKI